MPILALFFFIAFNIHLIFNLEKIIFFNEIICATGLLFFAQKLLNIRKITKSETWIFLYIFYGALLVTYSAIFRKETSPYYFARTIPVYYSVFCFFLGPFLHKMYLRYFIHTKNFILKGIALVATMSGEGRLSNQALLPFIASSSRKNTLYLWLFVLVFALIKGGATSYFLLAAYTLVALSLSQPSIATFFCSKPVISLATVLLLFAAHFIYITFEDFYSLGFSVLGTNPDANAVWRLMLWCYLIENRFLENPFIGIGFGSKLFDPSDPYTFFIGNAEPDTTDLPYVLGPHNSFVFILVRMGLIGYCLATFAISSILTRAFSLWRHSDAAEMRPFIYASIFMIISASFNVVLESPLYGGAFWALLGVAHAATRTLVRPTENTHTF